MRKWFGFILCLVMAAALTGCGKGNSGSGHGTGTTMTSVSDVLKGGMTKEEPTVTPEAPTVKANPVWESGSATVASKSDSVDVDLSGMSVEMACSEISRMWETPEEYKGKTIRISGEYSGYVDPTTNNRYDNCIVYVDPTGCCTYGIEFVLTDEYKYPEYYPDEGATVCVVGVFDTYMEGEYEYLTLRNAQKAN